MEFTQSLIFLIVLFFSFVLHELAHGYTAEKMGDNTARMMGRLTVNPIPHLDLFGSILIPFILLASGSSIILGWPKSIPVNPANFHDRKKGLLRLGLAGLGSYLLVAVVFGVLLKVAIFFSWGIPVMAVFQSVMQVNLVLFLFNVIPVPNFDGWLVLQGSLNEYKHRGFINFMMQNRFWISLLVLFVVWTTPIFSWVVQTTMFLFL